MGRYLIIEELGQGGSGPLLRAYDPRLVREVALEVVPAEVLVREGAGGPSAKVQTIAELSHPNLVAIYGIDVFDECCVIAMQYVRGTSLGAWFGERRRWQDILVMFIAAGRGLHAAHAVGLAHGDFGVDDVLVGHDGWVRVGGFNLARSPDDSPGPAEDVQAFCLALSTALTERAEVAGRTRRADSNDSKSTNARAPVWPRAVPRAVREALARGLSERPSERWPSMEPLLQVLSRNALAPRRTAAAMAGLGTVTGIMTLWAAMASQQAERCQGAKVQLAGVWDESVRARVERGLRATKAANADEVWRSVASQIDAYALRWVTSHTETCEASSVRQEQSVEIMDLRMRCLHRAKVELRAVTDLLERADVQVVQKATDVLGILPVLERCADSEALAAQVPPPLPAEAAQVEAFSIELAAVKALRGAGKYPDTLARMQQIAPRIHDVAYAPLQTDAMLELGQAWEQAGQWTQAEEAFKRALRSALGARQWEEAELVAMRLVNNLVSLQARPADGLAYALTAKALLVHTRDTAEADLRSCIAIAYDTLGRHADAEVEHRAALAVAEREWGRDAYEVALYRGNLGFNLAAQGRAAEAEIEQRTSLRLRQQTLGPEHPDTASAKYDLGNTLTLQGRYAEAEVELRAAMDAWAKVLGDDHGRTALARRALAQALAGQGHTHEALERYEQALDALGRFLGPDHFFTATTRSGYATTLAMLRRYEEAELHVRQALTAMERSFASDHPHSARTRSALADILNRRGRFQEAEAAARLAVAAYETRRHFETTKAREQLAIALLGQALRPQAEAEFRIALALAKSRWPDDHPHVVGLTCGLARSMSERDRGAADGPACQAATTSFDPRPAKPR